VVACDGDRIVATRRASRVIRDSVVSKAITLRPHQFWGADVFCLPEYRNKGIGRHLQVFGDRVVAASGYTEMLGSIEVRNVPSLRAAYAAGRAALCYVSFVRILFCTRLRVFDRVPERFWGPHIRPTRSAARGDASQLT
jgi:hypothetical protein